MRLDSFKNSEVKDTAALAALLKEKGLEQDEDKAPASLAILTADVKKNNKKDDPSLRQQMLRWYNANSDMLVVACNNILRITREQNDEGNLLKYVEAFRSQETSLSMQVENLEVFDITFLEDFLFVNYSVMELLAKLTRPQGVKPKHLISDDIDNLTIFRLTNALVEFSRQEDSPYKRYDYANFLDVQTC